MADRPLACAVTMVRDDLFFLRLWLRYYGGLFGREALYIINHGDQPEVRALAQGCNLIAIPDDADPKFDTKRWRLLNGLVSGLRGYFSYVIIGDVDELVVCDPARGTLAELLAARRRRGVLTPFGLELLHCAAQEAEPLDSPLLGRRRFVQIAARYAKPCIIGKPTRLSRGGHFATHPKLNMPEHLYLFHLRYCDHGLYEETRSRRHATVARTGVKDPAQAMIGRHWFSKPGGVSPFGQIDERPIATSFDFSAPRAAMVGSWRQRPETEFWEFDRPEDVRVFEIPDRFFGVF